MKIKYDKEIDALYIEFGKSRAYKTSEKSNNVLIDYDKNGRVLGIEILDYSSSDADSSKFQVSVGQKKVAVLN